MLVKATQPVKDRIKRQILALQDAECRAQFGKTAPDYLRSAPLQNQQEVLDALIWKEYVQYRDILPSEWFNTIDTNQEFVLAFGDCECDCVSEIVGQHKLSTDTWRAEGPDMVFDRLTSHSFAFAFDLAQPYKVPMPVNGYRPYLKEVNPHAHPALLAAFKQAREVMKLVEKWRDTYGKVIEFIDSTKSLNEAAKLWPEVRAFIAPEDLRRLDEKTVAKQRTDRESKAREVLASLNTESIVADVVGIKLSAA